MNKLPRRILAMQNVRHMYGNVDFVVTSTHVHVKFKFACDERTMRANHAGVLPVGPFEVKLLHKDFDNLYPA